MTIKEIRAGAKTRAMHCLLDALEHGFNLDSDATLFALVRGAYRTGRPRTLNYIQRRAKKDLDYLRKNLNL